MQFANGDDFRRATRSTRRVSALSEVIRSSGRTNYLVRITHDGEYGGKPLKIWKACLWGLLFYGTFREVTNQVIPVLTASQKK